MTRQLNKKDLDLRIFLLAGAYAPANTVEKLVGVQKMKLTAMQNGNINGTKKLTMFTREINMFMT